MNRQPKLGPRRWVELADRLATIRDELQTSDELSPARQQEILQERAVRLAQPLSAENEPSSGAEYEVLGFVTGGEHHAFETRFVAKVLPVEQITPLPGLPPYIAGIMPADGSVVSIVDLRSLLHIPMTRLAEPSAVIVLRNETNEFGVLAEEITGMQRFLKDAVQPGSACFQDRDSLLLGVTIDRMGILDAQKLLTDPRLIIDAS